MSVGDLVRLKTRPSAQGCIFGIVVSIEENGWLSILRSDGTISLWPGQEMEKANEVG